MSQPNLATSEDVVRIFRQHKLADKPRVQRVNIGFTNEIYQVDEYILKIYLRPDGEANYLREAKLYQRLDGKALTPKFILSDGSKDVVPRPYIIYRRIDGEPLGSLWHGLSDDQRREIVKVLCQQIRAIADLEPNIKLGKSWRSHVEDTIKDRLKVVEAKHFLEANKIDEIKGFVKSNGEVLNPENIGFIYWDIHLDNIIVADNKMVGLIDLEHVDPVSLDYALNNVQRMVKYPYLNLSEEMERHARTEDYDHLMIWFKQFYPELFDFPKLDTRLKFYELEEVLRMIPRYPKAQHLYERLANVLDS